MVESHLTRYCMYNRMEEFFNSQPPLTGRVLCVSGAGTIASFFQNAKLHVTQYPQVDVTNMPYQENNFDHVMSDQVLEHVSDPFKAVEEMYRVLKPDGWMILTTCLMNPVHSAGGWSDYWRFTPEGLRHLCTKVAKFSTIAQCEGWGNPQAMKVILEGGRMTPVTDKNRAMATRSDHGYLITTWVIAQK